MKQFSAFISLCILTFHLNSFCQTKKNTEDSLVEMRKTSGQQSESIQRMTAGVKKKRYKKRKKKSAKKRLSHIPSFYIPYERLRVLSWQAQISYYTAFQKFVKDTNFSLRKNKKYSSHFRFSNPLEEIFFPRSNAVLCSTAGWIIENNLDRCDQTIPPGRSKASFWFDQRESSDWTKFKPTHIKYGCGSRQICPVIFGIRMVGDQAFGLCSDQKGSSQICAKNEKKYNGTENLVRLKNNCSTRQTSTATNLTCSELSTDLEKSVNMYSTGCSSVRGTCSKQNVLACTCDRLDHAVKSINQKIDFFFRSKTTKKKNPTKTPPEFHLPDHIPSCKTLSKKLETDKEGVSPHWKALVTMASKNCPSMRQKDINAAFLKFGKCSKNMPSKRNTEKQERLLNSLVSNFSNNYTNKEYIKTFVKNFGITPGNFKGLFCTSGGSVDFNQRLKKIRKYTDATNTWLINNLEYFERSENINSKVLSKQQFNSFKKFLMENEQSINLIMKNFNNKGVPISSNVQTRYSDAQVRHLILKTHNQLKDNPGKRAEMNKILNKNFEKLKDPTYELALRRQFNRVLRTMVLSPDYGQKTQNSISYMNECAKEVLTKGDPINDPNIIGGYKAVSNHQGCKYVKEGDIAGYTRTSLNPYIVFDRTQNKCLEQIGGMKPSSTSLNGVTTTVQSFLAEAPGEGKGTRKRVYLTPNKFDTKTDGIDSLKNFVLYQYVCDAKNNTPTAFDDIGVTTDN